MSLRIVPTRRTPAPMEHNPYAPPRAELTRKPAEDAGEWRERGEVVPALHGLVWIRDAWLLFWERPWTWIWAFTQIFFCYCLLQSIPVVGMASAFLWPFILGGVAFTAHRLRLGEDISASDIYDVFHARFYPLACLGLFALLLDGVLYISNEGMAGIGALSDLVDKIPKSSSWLLLARMLLLLGITGLLLYLVQVLPVFLPAALAAVGERNAVAALRDGIGGMFRNWTAFLVYSLAVVLLVLAVGGLAIACVLGLIFIDAPFHLAGAALLGVLISLFSTGFCTLTAYTATRDIFYEEG